jgi:hypothetical protein
LKLLLFQVSFSRVASGKITCDDGRPMIADIFDRQRLPQLDKKPWRMQPWSPMDELEPAHLGLEEMG